MDTGIGVPVPEARTWALDNLGNWSGGDATTGSLIWGDDTDGVPDGVPDANVVWTHHAVDKANAITQIAKDTSATPTTLDYDLAGNLVSDGTYFLQYDGFNRLVQVNAIGTATLNANGEVTAGMPGDMVVQFVYDGLGRLIRSVRPDRTEDHYYDGVRRIHTDVTIHTTTTTDRQYVYGPDYVDEFVAQIDDAGAVFYMLQDANYNVVALVNAAGAVVEQYAYRPYGGLVAVDTLQSGGPVNTAGHQGLFYERLGGQGLAVGATGFYYNRNRFYSP
ncbi:MAG: RHS repeat protein, partial [Phycisphaerae bacterium]|nr:RHS repeat protein [Phycisphaerae bacterium]